MLLSVMLFFFFHPFLSHVLSLLLAFPREGKGFDVQNVSFGEGEKTKSDRDRRWQRRMTAKEIN